MIKPRVYSAYDISSFPKVLSDQPIDVSYMIDSAISLEDTAKFKVVHQIEPPEVTDVVEFVINNHTRFDLILAWNTRILKACPNAVLFPLACCSWIPWNDAGVNFNHARPADGSPHVECDPSKKQFKVSYLTSNKEQTPGHKLRQQVYDALPSTIGGLQVDKHKSPPWIPDKRPMVYDYQFMVSPLNASHDNWIDDKMIDPLIAKTIPLIWGCPNLGEFFNMDGIIRFDTVPELLDKLAALTPNYYNDHLEAVLENYHRALEYTPVWTRVDREISKRIGTRNADSVDPRRPDSLREGSRRPLRR